VWRTKRNRQEDGEMSERDAYVEKMKARLDEWNAELSRLSAKADGAKADAKLEHERAIAELKTQRDEMQQQLGKVMSASEDAWDDLRKGADSAWDKLGEAFESASKRFR